MFTPWAGISPAGRKLGGHRSREWRQGGTWSVLDQYAETGLSYAHNRAFAADRVTGNLFAGGNLNNLLPDGTC